MPGDSSGRRSALLTRWRGALRLVPEPDSVVLAAAELAEAPEPRSAVAESATVSGATDESGLFSSFEAEIRRVVAQPIAERLIALLGPSREAALAERNAATCAACLAQLDVLEDVLDALLLVNASSGEGAAPGTVTR